MPESFPEASSPLAEPQRLLLSVLASLPDTAVVVVDHQLVLRFVGGPALEQRGWDPDAVVGQPLSAVLGERTALYEPHYRIALSGGSSTLEAPDGPQATVYRTEFLPLRLPGTGIAGAIAVVRDVSQQLEDRAALARSEREFRLAFDDAPIGMALVDLGGRFTRVNTALCDLLERPAEDLLQCTFQELTAPEDLDIDLEHLRRLTAGEIPRYAMEKRYLAPDGGRIWTQLSVSLLRDGDGRPEGFISQVQDIGERRRMQDVLQHLADHDTLSGLWNRRRFEEELRREIVRVRRHGVSSAVLLFDLDGLKVVNDTFGHPCGDELIRAIAHAVRRRLRETDAVARIGGDEFAILLTSVDADAAVAVAEKICATVREVTVDIGGQIVSTTTSVGVATVAADVTDAQELLAAVDRAMYAAKADGGDSVAAAAR